MKYLSLIARVIIGLLVGAALTVSAQIQQAWVAKYSNGIPNGNHEALKMLLDSAGNVYVLGVSQNINTNTGYVVIKYAPNGNQLWAARCDSTSFPTATPTGFVLDNSNAVVVTGSAVTVKYDGNGRLLWTAPYSAQAVAVDPGDNTYLTGVSNNFSTVKLGPAGSNIWNANWTYQGLANLSEVIAIDSSTNIYVSGSEQAKAPFNYYEVDVGTVKYDKNGNQIWEANEAVGPNGGVQVVGIATDLMNDVYVECNFLSGISSSGGPYETLRYNTSSAGGQIAFDPTQNSGSFASGMLLDSLGNVLVTGENAHHPPLPSYGTYKIDTNGNYLWGKLYPVSSYGSSGATALAVDSANAVYVTGASTITNTGSDVATIKYDSNGNQIWVQRYDGPGHGNDAGSAIAVDNSGNVYVAGYETETNGFTSMILIKYSPVTVQKQSSGNFILDAYGSPGETFDIQASTNLQTWQDLGTIAADTNGLAQFADTNAPLFPARFYYTVPQ